MKKEQRVTEIISQITAFSKDSYTKSEYLPELFKLQKELVDLTFNAEHAEHSELRLWDVVNHFRKLNEERGHIADELLAQFEKDCKTVSNKICAEISGNKGEQRAFRALDNLECPNSVLHNVELEFDGRRTEIDAIVFTNQAIFIIEIKNSKKDLFIDIDGGFFKAGNSSHYDGNIADKMDEREALLRRALKNAGVGQLKIIRIMTYTNLHIDVENNYRYVTVRPYNVLPSFINKFSSNQWYSDEDICYMTKAVIEAKCSESYQMAINMDNFKRCFSELMACLEAPEKSENESENRKKSLAEDVQHSKMDASSDTIPNNHENGLVVAAVCVTLINMAIFIGNKLLKK